jgi:hypothetical protein
MNNPYHTQRGENYSIVGEEIVKAYLLTLAATVSAVHGEPLDTTSFIMENPKEAFLTVIEQDFYGDVWAAHEDVKAFHARAQRLAVKRGWVSPGYFNAVA